MSLITGELRRTQREIVQRLSALKQALGSPVAAHALAELMASVRGYMQVAEANLYPALREIARTDSALRWLLRQSSYDIEETAIDFGRFCVKYDPASPDLPRRLASLDFARDFGAIASRLHQRMQAEATLIFPEFDRRGLAPIEPALDPQRRSPRVQVDFPAAYRSAAIAAAGRVVNISDGGLFLLATELDLLGSIAEIELSVPRLGALLLEGEVRWCQPFSPRAPGGMGIRFQTPPPSGLW